MEVFRHFEKVIEKNRPTSELTSFLGAGCWPHYVPAIVDEVIGRSEFLTAYAGSAATDLGRFQSVFEFQSMMGDLLEMDVVSAPIYDGPTSAGDAVLMGARVTNRHELLVPGTISPDRLSTLKVYAASWLEIKVIRHDPETGLIDLDDLRSKISDNAAVVYVENPTYLGFIEEQCAAITEIAHANGALVVSYVNPISLGVLTPPGLYGADIACGEGQPLGMHMSCGGATLGILACRDDERLVSAMPSFLIGLTPTVEPGELAFSRHNLFERTMFVGREKVRSFTGTAAWLWAIGAGVYMSLLGPSGFTQIGEVNMQKSAYATAVLAGIKGIRTPVLASTHFNEFTVNFDGTGKTVAQVNGALLELGILGGKDISREFPTFGQTALYCVTEMHTKGEIDRLAEALEHIVG